MTDFVTTQVGFERAALRLVDRPDVRAALAGLATRWRDGTPGFLPETYAKLPSSLDEVALLVALQVVDGDPRRPEIVEISAGPHAWGGLEVPGGRWGINNPDTLYFAAPIERGSSYVLRGRRDVVAPTDLNVSVQTPDVWGTLDSLGSRDLTVDANGDVMITIGDHQRRDVDHLPIKAGGSVLLIRQTLADWDTELPYALSIERTHGPEPAAPATEDELAQRLITRLGVVVDHSLDTLQPPVFSLPLHVIPRPGAAGDKPGYLVAQRNTLGHFRLADDEALILVITTGGAGYTAVAAPNIWGVTSDSARHRNSLNSHQARLDPDGRFTVIVSTTDPGVANWLDPGGLREGILMLRWQLLTEQPDAPEEPSVSVRRIRLADLSEALPETARQTTTPAERQRLSAERRAGYERRFAARDS